MDWDTRDAERRAERDREMDPRDRGHRDAQVQRGMERIGRAIARKRRRRRLTQGRLARMILRNQSTISRVERGKRGLRWSTFARLVDVLEGLDFEAMLGDPSRDGTRDGTRDGRDGRDGTRGGRDGRDDWMERRPLRNPYAAQIEAELAAARREIDELSDDGVDPELQDPELEPDARVD